MRDDGSVVKRHREPACGDREAISFPHSDASSVFAWLCAVRGLAAVGARSLDVRYVERDDAPTALVAELASLMPTSVAAAADSACIDPRPWPTREVEPEMASTRPRVPLGDRATVA